MVRLVIGFVLFGVICSVKSRTCSPDEGITPGPCDENICLLPDCVCEESEPDVPLAERPQVIMK